MNKRVLALAKATREEIQRFAFNNRHIGNVRFLNCFCAIASYTLRCILNKHGFKTTFVKGLYDRSDQHCWVTTVDDSFMIDLTASQFGIFTADGVYIQPVDSSAYKTMYKPKAENPNSRSFYGWADQSPFDKHNLVQIKAIIKKV